MTKLSSKQLVADEIYRHVATSAYHFFYLYSLEESKASEIIKLAAEQAEIENVYLFDIAWGLRAERDKRVRLLKDHQKKDILLVIDWAIANEIRGFLVFFNPNPIVEQNPVVGRSIKNLANAIREKELPLTCFIVSPYSRVPDEISSDVAFIDIPLPTRDEIREIIEQVVESLGYSVIDENIMKRLIDSLHGMREEDVVRAVKLGLYDGLLDERDLEAIWQMKHYIIRREGILDFILPQEGLESVGGMEKLKTWIERKRRIFARLEEAKEEGVDVPKGILLFGMPGCGKSLVAKAVANLFSMPLLRLDMGRVLGPYVGQSEENIRRAIKLSEAISPAVLWIDEIEKAFSGIGGDEGSGGVMTRVFGSFLTWMQEKTKPVFVIATANNISRMPPEFLRKGRFDEIFFVDFPGRKAREEIFLIHLKKRKRELWRNNPSWDSWITKTEGFSGADIEAVIKEAVEEDFVNDGNINVENTMERILKEFKPMSKSMPEKIREIRKKCDELEAKPVE